jgi:hypothetical protein
MTNCIWLIPGTYLVERAIGRTSTFDRRIDEVGLTRVRVSRELLALAARIPDCRRATPSPPGAARRLIHPASGARAVVQRQITHCPTLSVRPTLYLRRGVIHRFARRAARALAERSTVMSAFGRGSIPRSGIHF